MAVPMAIKEAAEMVIELILRLGLKSQIKIRME
ncbi:hypothetical protein Goshw_017604 [Gossypium schwendimanii]|uniref:Uncharacterized protein n=1 Tax=Gossypium schwendimanii TaxID=34291 RepID=A0A7J9M5L4_GOSSC|nr:hypothetical protein [Gossypium schwendimanii]